GSRELAAAHQRPRGEIKWLRTEEHCPNRRLSKTQTDPPMNGWLLRPSSVHLCTNSEEETEMKVLFGVWGVLGFLVAILTMIPLWMETNMTVIKAAGMGAYISSGMLFWIGGMVVLGFASLMQQQKPEPKSA